MSRAAVSGRVALRLGAVLLALAAAACGGTTQKTVISRTTSNAQELNDLRAALAAGAITPAQYQAQAARFGGGY